MVWLTLGSTKSKEQNRKKLLPITIPIVNRFSKFFH